MLVSRDSERFRPRRYEREIGLNLSGGRRSRRPRGLREVGGRMREWGGG
jgi:hypothetical protein